MKHEIQKGLWSEVTGKTPISTMTIESVYFGPGFGAKM
jgi:hypothetical protein